MPTTETAVCRRYLLPCASASAITSGRAATKTTPQSSFGTVLVLRSRRHEYSRNTRQIKSFIRSIMRPRSIDLTRTVFYSFGRVSVYRALPGIRKIHHASTKISPIFAFHPAMSPAVTTSIDPALPIPCHIAHRAPLRVSIPEPPPCRLQKLSHSTHGRSGAVEYLSLPSVGLARVWR